MLVFYKTRNNQIQYTHYLHIRKVLFNFRLTSNCTNPLNVSFVVNIKTIPECTGYSQTSSNLLNMKCQCTIGIVMFLTLMHASKYNFSLTITNILILLDIMGKGQELSCDHFTCAAKTPSVVTHGQFLIPTAFKSQCFKRNFSDQCWQ